MSITKKTESSFLSFDNINTTLETQKIKAQILHLWKKYLTSSGNSLEMVLVDEEGTRMHATVKEAQIKKFAKDLKEGVSLTINAFECKENLGDYRTTPIPYKIHFMRTTKIKVIDDFPKDIPEKYFADFSSILYGNLDRNILIDAIGQIINVDCSEIQKSNGTGNVTKVDVHLRDTLDVPLTCTLWGDYGKQVVDYTAKHTTNVIFVIRFACIKEYKGVKYIQNAFNSTQILFDPTTEQVEKFRKFLPGDNQMITHDSSQMSWGSAINYEAEFLIHNPKKTITMINEGNQVGTIVTLATVKSIDTTKNWYYYVCTKCKGKVQQYGESSGDEDQKPLFNCEKCDDVEDVDTRYYLILRVTDELLSEVRFLLFDNIAKKQLFNRHSSELIEEANEENESILPQTINNLIGKTLLFKITIAEENLKGKHLPYKVDIVSDNGDIIVGFQSRPISEEPLLLTNSLGESETSLSSSITPLSNKTRGSPNTNSIEDQNSVTKKIKVEKTLTTNKE